MSLINPQLPKQYKNSKVLFEKNLDAWRVAAESAFAAVNLNLTQLRKDCFLSTYDFDNDGIGNLPKSLQQQINDLTSGAIPLSGTTADSWVINADGNAVILSSAGLTDSNTYLFSDANGYIPSLPTQATTETGTGAIVREDGATLSNVTMSDVAMSNVTITGTFVFPNNTPGAVPIGTILPFYDFNGALAFNTAAYGYCNGQALTFTGIGSQTTPDLSGRYLVGFGTVGGADIGSAVWATAAIGANSINLEHLHSVDSHTHDMANHTHTGGSHTHDMGDHTHARGSLHAQIAIGPGLMTAVDGISYKFETVPSWTSDDKDNAGGDTTGGDSFTVGVPCGGVTDVPSTNTTSGATGNTGTPSTNTTGGSSGNTGNSLSTAQDIRPSSIRVRYIIRYA